MFNGLHKLTRNRYVGSFVYWLGYFYLSLLNHIVNKIPFFSVRYFICKYLYGLKIGNSVLHMGVIMFSPWKIKIGDNVLIHFDCFLDGRGEIEFGDNIDVSFGVKIFSEQHDLDSDMYDAVAKKVTVGDNAVLGSYSIILPGVSIGEGAVVAAGSVVSRDVEPYTVVGGVPAKKIKDRVCDVAYKLTYKRPFH